MDQGKVTHLKRGENDELFRSKPKRRGKNNTVITDPLKCQIAECDNDDEDALVKCNGCGVWVCEGCHDVPIAKLKQVMNKCQTVYFACKSCDLRLKEFPEIVITPPENPNPTELIPVSAENPNLISSIKQMFNQQVSTLENKLVSIIDEKLRDKGLTNRNTGEEGSEEGEVTVHPPTLEVKETYAKVLRVPEEVRKAIQDAKNDERVEESEQEKRAKNFIIHGADEYGETSKEIQEADDGYVKEIFQHLGASPRQPVKIMRLGKPNDHKRRPMKVIMNTKEEKEKVMSNLSKLKGTDDYFGRISITEDYTQTEREQISAWNDKAKAKSAQDADFVYKVRGDPKNGLRLIRLARK